MTVARSILAAGMFGLLLAVPVAAQNATPQTAPSDAAPQRGLQMPGIVVTPPVLIPPRMRMERRNQSEPSSRADDEFEAPSDGCRYQDNKLDLIV